MVVRHPYPDIYPDIYPDTTTNMNSKRPHNLNRKRSHSLIRWSDVQVTLTLAVFAAAAWTVGYGITTLVMMFQYRY